MRQLRFDVGAVILLLIATGCAANTSKPEPCWMAPGVTQECMDLRYIRDIDGFIPAAHLGDSSQRYVGTLTPDTIDAIAEFKQQLHSLKRSHKDYLFSISQTKDSIYISASPRLAPEDLQAAEAGATTSADLRGDFGFHGLYNIRAKSMDWFGTQH